MLVVEEEVELLPQVMVVPVEVVMVEIQEQQLEDLAPLAPEVVVEDQRNMMVLPVVPES